MLPGLSVAAGVLVLVLGGYLVVEGASYLAHRLGVSDLGGPLIMARADTGAP